MDGLLEIALVGLSHRSAPVALRERCAVEPERMPDLLKDLVGQAAVAEACVLSTCNRTEALLVAVEGEDPVPGALRRVFDGVAPEALYVHRGVHAVIHLFRVASGLDSLVIGESEILAQTKRAFEAARAAGTTGPTLEALLRQTLGVGKRVRNETELGQGTLSVARVAVDVAHRAFGDLRDNSALVVGAGETGLLVARHLRAAGVGALSFANRTRSRAEHAAAEVGGTAHGLDELPALAPAADVLVVCVDRAGGSLLGPADFDERALRKRDQPVVVIDLSVPRAVDPALGRLRQILLYDLDDLEPVVEQHRRERDQASAGAAEILVAEVHKFLALRTYAAFTPTIAELRDRFERARDEVLDAIAHGDATPRELELSRALERRLLDLALSSMKEGARRSRSTEAVDRAYQRFLEQQ